MNIYCSWVLVVIFAGFLILGLAYVHWLLFGAALSLIAFFFTVPTSSNVRSAAREKTYYD